MDISVVTTLYRSAPHLEQFYRRIKKQVVAISADHEIIFVNDGSPDDSLQIALRLQEEDPAVEVVDLSRNFGHHRAIITGLSHASGKHVFLIDCDLEEEPELLGSFYERLQGLGVDVVFGVQDRRKGGILEAALGLAFYKLFNLCSDLEVPANSVVARLMTQRYVKSLIAHREREIFLLGLMQLTGYSQHPITIRKLSRDGSSYTFARKLAVAAISITSFSNRPLIFIFVAGLTISACAFAYLSYLAVWFIMFGQRVPGWASVIASVWLLGGATIFSLGVIGIYLSKVFIEVKERPYAIIRNHYKRPRKS